MGSTEILTLILIPVAFVVVALMVGWIERDR